MSITIERFIRGTSSLILGGKSRRSSVWLPETCFITEKTRERTLLRRNTLEKHFSTSNLYQSVIKARLNTYTNAVCFDGRIMLKKLSWTFNYIFYITGEMTFVVIVFDQVDFVTVDNFDFIYYWLTRLSTQDRPTLSWNNKDNDNHEGTQLLLIFLPQLLLLHCLGLFDV